MKNAFVLGIKLALYASAACLALAVVNNFTAPEIATHALKKEQSALKIIFPQAEKFEKIEKISLPQSSATIDSFYKVIQDGNVAGFVIKITGSTYETSTLVAGFSPELQIAGVHILATSDSPGFGQKAADANYRNSKGTTFYGQFAGTSAKKPLVLGEDYEAISGATITSRTMGALISNAAEAVKIYIEENGGAR